VVLEGGIIILEMKTNENETKGNVTNNGESQTSIIEERAAMPPIIVTSFF